MLRLYTKFVCCAVLFLIFAGASVTSNQAGLAVPDWPSTYGQNMFLFPFSEWRGNIFYEHSHRLIASGVGFLTIILTIWIVLVEKRRWVRNLTYCAMAAVVFQGILGGLTVLYFLPTSISVAHALLAQTFFVLTIIIAYSQSRELQLRQANKESNNTFGLSLLCVAVVYLQLFLGALMRHSEAGLAILDFPQMAGAYWPTFSQSMLAQINDMRFGFGLDPVTLYQVIVHFFHRFGALLVLLVFLIFLHRIFRGPATLLLKRAGLYLSVLLVLQIALGILTVVSLKQPVLTSLHVVTGALLLGVTVLASLRSYTGRLSSKPQNAAV